MGGVGSGPKAKTKARREALISMDMLLPGALDVLNMTLIGNNTDRLRYEAAKDCYEFNCGKAKQHMDIDAKVEEKLSPGDMLLLYEAMKQLREAENSFLIEGEVIEGETLSFADEETSFIVNDETVSKSEEMGEIVS